MKKMILLFSVLMFYSCVCNNEEVGTQMVDIENKEYLKNTSEKITFVDQDGNALNADFEAANYYTQREDIGPESCEYITYEYGKRKFIIGKYQGEFNIDYTNFYLSIHNYVASNYLFLEENSIGKIDALTEDAEVAGFSFNNVIVFENRDKKDIWDIEKMIYSKENGVEFILFRNGNWYKRS